MKTIIKRQMLIIAVLIAVSLSARAELFSFYSLGNDTNGVAGPIGEAQLSVDVTELTSTTARFLFANEGLDDNYVDQICFAFAPEVNPGYISSLPEWNLATNPGEMTLPGAVGSFISDICLLAPPPPNSNGLTPGNSPLEVILSYDAGFDVLAALHNTDLQIGMHALSIGPGQDSESFINNIPEPSTALLLGFVALVGKSYRKIFVV